MAVMGVAILLGFSLIMAMNTIKPSYGAMTSRRSMAKIWRINKDGPYLGIVVPNAFEMNPLLNSSTFVQDSNLTYLDFGGRRFRFGKIKSEKVIIVMTGLGMLNAGISTQLLISLFKLKGVVHFGVAGNANPNLQIGDVTIPNYWGHTGLWNWQRYGDGENDELALEASGDYTREIGFLKFSNYNNLSKKNGKELDNYLNRVWYQPEEVFPVDGVPEVRQHALWVPVDTHYHNLSKKLEDLVLENCANTTNCLERKPKVVWVERGCSANTFVDNAAYREYLRSKFNVSPVDMETAAVALVSLQQRTPFIAFRSLSDLAGGGSALSNEASVYASLAAQNAVTAAIQFISLLSSS
ncbi:hypothetical protein J5N97_007599 [Dioscorea zingiberensis]|uniref:Nucleoside phosphorylase domain-containing protein n=1 Tax=Dioscorea zingiberensis TaxID=325984 RepID=A0A9D5DDR7_9LILI|nr:hypothetical protein J5N97_007599 [Dioscorea zingiberensis]